MKGLLTTYRAYLPITSHTPTLTLGEGDTPLVAAPAISRETGAGPSVIAFTERSGGNIALALERADIAETASS